MVVGRLWKYISLLLGTSVCWRIWPRCLPLLPEHLLYSPPSAPPPVVQQCRGQCVVGGLWCSQTASWWHGISEGAVCSGTCSRNRPALHSTRSQRMISCETPKGSDMILIIHPNNVSRHCYYDVPPQANIEINDKCKEEKGWLKGISQKLQDGHGYRTFSNIKATV